MPFPFQIFQSANGILITYEYAGAVREVYLKDPGPPPVESWMGQSVGRWEGETLVVEVTGFNDRTWFDRSGNFHSEQLRVVGDTPRWPRITSCTKRPSRIEVFTRPWTIRMPLYRRVEPGAQLFDFKCVEFVEELMYGQYRRNPVTR
jgi:hypothetical protein